jgi:hypothetical protein
MGIANPVTRETYGSGTQYHMQLAKQLAGILQAPLEVKPNLSIFLGLGFKLRVLSLQRRCLTT